MRHPELAEIAGMLVNDSPFSETCRHLAETCPVCGERLAQVEALMKRFRHWDAEMAVREGLEADSLLAMLLGRGEDFAAWAAEVEKKPEAQTWAVACVALEGAQALFADESFRRRARDLARLAVLIAGCLGTSYHPESVADLKARAHATAAAVAEDRSELLHEMAAAITALDEGTGDEAVAEEVLGLLARVLR